jgi:hypothetical protein
MADDYQYDLFLSFRHKPPVIDWLRRHFFPKLEQWLPNAMSRDPAIFVDWNIETGAAWPLVLKEGLLRSRCMLAVWTPEYFRSSWCLAEWQSFRAREQRLGLTTKGLIYPVVYFDGEHFPDEAKATQMKDLRTLNHPDSSFAKTRKYVQFDAMVQEICGELAMNIATAPPWQAEWPIELPTPPTLVNVPLPRLG